MPAAIKRRVSSARETSGSPEVRERPSGLLFKNSMTYVSDEDRDRAPPCAVIYPSLQGGKSDEAFRRSARLGGRSIDTGHGV